MIKRPLDLSLAPAVLAGIKTNTMRKSSWPLGRAIMLYHWSGKPYASKHVNVAPVIADQVTPIEINHDGHVVHFHTPEILLPENLWYHEGFASPQHMDQWFLTKHKPHRTHHLFLHFFKLYQP